MRFDIIYLSLGLASVVYAFPVSQRVSVTTGPVTNQATIPLWDIFEELPIRLNYKYVPPSTKEHQQDNKYAGYADDVVNKILERKGDRISTVPFTGDPRWFSFEILTPIRVFDVVCPCTVDVVVVAQNGGAGAQATSTFRETRCKDHFINGVSSLPDGLDPHAKPPSRPESPASDSSHCPASAHSPGPPHSPGSTHSSDSWDLLDSPHSPGSPHPDSHSDSATPALPQSPGSPHSPASPASPAPPQSVTRLNSGQHRIAGVAPQSYVLSGNSSLHVGNTYHHY
ncbi:hypothetical protein C8R41DRAFT_925577 [Lentinula lateritia]|uniref:Uncharacterized protein n=1 Tax=Lentinula lateritia TaxID=40482 RepID=A0ABQ8V0A1_9AGAR|nr:hypothetical protein C8R41DRAFT_925577 [Lentinula lateritia]